jgi:hypothetical protein
MVTGGRLLKTIQIPEAYEDYFDIDDPEKVIATLKTLKPRADVFCFWQRLPETQPKYGYRMEWDNVAAIKVNSFAEWLEKTAHSSVRTKLRKAMKTGVMVEVVDFDDKLIKGMSEIFNETPIRQGRPYSHYGRSLDEIRAEWSADLDMSVFIGAYYEDELIGFVKLTYTDRYAEMSGTICKLAHRDKPAMSALISRSVQFCEEMRIPYLTYGKFTYGKKGEDSLSDFKRYNGFQKIELPRYYVPLTLWGQLGLSLGLHHKLSDRLPSRVREKLMELRTKYYQRRLASAN